MSFSQNDESGFARKTISLKLKPQSLAAQHDERLSDTRSISPAQDHRSQTSIKRPPLPRHHGGTLQWDHKVHLIGEKVYNPSIHICTMCDLPILIYGRMAPCKHVFCYDCAVKSTETKICTRCNDRVERIEPNRLGTVFVCSFREKNDKLECGRSYLSSRDLDAHVGIRHQQQAPQSQTQIALSGAAQALPSAQQQPIGLQQAPNMPTSIQQQMFQQQMAAFVTVSSAAGMSQPARFQNLQLIPPQGMQGAAPGAMIRQPGGQFPSFPIGFPGTAAGQPFAMQPGSQQVAMPQQPGMPQQAGISQQQLDPNFQQLAMQQQLAQFATQNMEQQQRFAADQQRMLADQQQQQHLQQQHQALMSQQSLHQNMSPQNSSANIEHSASSLTPKIVQQQLREQFQHNLDSQTVQLQRQQQPLSAVVSSPQQPQQPPQQQLSQQQPPQQQLSQQQSQQQHPLQQQSQQQQPLQQQPQQQVTQEVQPKPAATQVKSWAQLKQQNIQLGSGDFDNAN